MVGDFSTFCLFLLGFTEFDRVLPGFSGFYRVLLGFTGFYRVLLGFTGFYWVLLAFPGFYRVLPGYTGYYRVLAGFRGFSWGRNFRWTNQSEAADGGVRIARARSASGASIRPPFCFIAADCKLNPSGKIHKMHYLVLPSFSLVGP